MKIEKINDNQIRCTLTHADLAERHLKLSELAYGTEKAKSLFRDMMQQAAFDFGFDAEDIPLMIEAIPTSADTIVLIITKVEDPEELDTRFSKFTPSSTSDSSIPETLEKLEGAEDFMELLDKVKKAAAGTNAPATEKKSISKLTIRLFSFENIDDAIQAAHLIAPIYHGANTLYHDPDSGMYVLALKQSDHSEKEFNKISNMLSEYSSIEKVSPATLAFLEEHYDILISSNAIQNLGLI